jgi:beta-glucanase (GH16 family)
VIEARQERVMGSNYTSARLNTIVWGQWKYGRFEIRARLPNTQGIWPAFWLLPANLHYGHWPAGGEIDIMEMIGSEPGRVYGTLHFGNPHEMNSGTYDLPIGQDFSDDFHVFALAWEPGLVRWYVDDVLYHTADEWFTSGDGEFPAPFDQEFYLIINVAVGGYWPGSPDSTSVFPQYLYVDYVRVYQEAQ